MPLNPDDEIFSEALDLPAGERAAYLDRACAGDAVQRARILALLAGHAAAAGFLERPLLEGPVPVPEAKPGDVIGRYTLLRQIGQGGGGVVFLAEQNEPVRRRVALKIIKLGMDTRAVITRFEAERQTLAMMDHPDIARVFDAGATETGRPFFVMEFVDGVSITKFCDEQSLSMAARLRLFARVCVALQHAHQKGIIHRDLKPSNILVAMQDGVPAPKVIDFGIAKATQGRLTEQSFVTGLEQFMGTPAYMSPEQAERRDLDIDTRSDVYSLGVVLYELLTGRPPHDPDSLVRAGFDEIRRIIREVDPPRPSTRVSTLAGADRATVARLRGAGPTQLGSFLSGDLDWIVMRCLEKNRDRRYGTAQELADDVRRHLGMEPVLARPPSAAYRLRKFFVRNRVACLSGAAVALALIVGTTVSVRQAVLATRAGRAEAVARADAQRRQEQAEALLTFMLGDFRAERKKAGKLSLLDEVGEQALAYFAALDPRDLNDTVLIRQAKALTQIGETRIDQARFADADAAFAAAYARAAALAGRHPRDGDMLFERAQAEYWIGFIARRRGNLAVTHEWFTRYRDSALALVALEGKKPRAQRELVSGRHNLAVLDYDRGNLAGARAGLLAEIPALNDLIAATPGDLTLRFRLADVASWLGLVAEREGQFEEALARFADMATRVEELAALEPAVPRWREKIAESTVATANILAVTGRAPEALATYARAGVLLDALAEQDPNNQQRLVRILSLRLRQVGLLAARDVPAARAVLEPVRNRLINLVAGETSSRIFTGRLAHAWQLEARLRFTSNETDVAAAIEQALELGNLLIRENRADDVVLTEFAQTSLLAGRLAQREGRAADARRHWDTALTTLASRLPDSNDWRILDPAAQAHLLRGEIDAARPLAARLRRLGYRTVDPLAAFTLEAAQ